MSQMNRQRLDPEHRAHRALECQTQCYTLFALNTPVISQRPVSLCLVPRCFWLALGLTVSSPSWKTFLQTVHIQQNNIQLN